MSVAVSVSDLSKHYGSEQAVDRMSFDVQPGEMIALLGPSGCGKTTTLRMIAGFVEASGGDILLDGRSILALPTHRRNMGVVFQSYALFPHLTVAKNVAFGLEMHGVPKAERLARVMDVLKLVKLEGFAERYPKQLSGGQQQRVAIARALATHPRLLLLDEPLSNLDAALRSDVARDIRMLQKSHGLTALMVTHDQSEAMAMADRLVVMRAGRIEQIGTQEDVYERPATPFVAGFIGHSNLIQGQLSDAGTLDCGGVQVALAGRYEARGAVTLALKPERIVLTPAGTGGDERVSGRIELATYLGTTVEQIVRLGDARLVIRSPSSGPAATRRFAEGELVGVSWAIGDERVFSEDDRPLSAGH